MAADGRRWPAGRGQPVIELIQSGENEKDLGPLPGGAAIQGRLV
jgi:hypothetical protein